MDGYNPFSLAGKTILVTGASSGIGQTTAIECAKLGAKLVVTGRDAARLQATFDRLEGDGHRQVMAELTSDDDLAKLAEACPELNGVVFSAGVSQTLPLALATKKKFAEVFGVNFSAPVECLRLLFMGKKIAPAGSVVFVSSCAGMRGGTAVGEGAYGASKAALGATVRYFAKEFGPRKIRFNAVNPGVVNTPFGNTPLRANRTDEQRAAERKSYPLGRLGEPIDVAHGIVYLLSDASSWVTGQQLVIDGGLTI